jgi:trigger factor
VNVKVSESGQCRKVLEIEIPADEVSRERAGLIGEFQKYAHIPGFRVGKAPKQMIEQKFSKQIEEELQKKLIPQFYREALAKEKLKPVSYPELSDIQFKQNSPLTFKATVDVAPDFELPSYKDIEVKRQKSDIPEEEIDKALTSIREQQADFAEVSDRALKLGDYAILNYHGTVDGKPIGEISPAAKLLGENKSFWLLMAKDAFVPGFCEQLVGAKIGDKKEVNVEFPEKFFNKDVAGKKARYEVEITGIREKKLPELNDEFAKALQFESVAKLREKIRENLEANFKRQAEGNEKNQIVDFLLKKVKVELPDSLVQAQTRRNVFDLVRENQMRGVSEDDLKGKKEEIFKFANESAKDHVKAQFVLTRIAEKEGIKVEPAELEARIAELAENSKSTPEKLREELESGGGAGMLEEQILVSKTLDFLLANAKFAEVEPEKTKK